MLLSKIAKSISLANSSKYAFSVANESTFLEMVREYFDKAG